jgi:hypothetical protein
MEKHEQQRKQNLILGEQRAKVDWDDECTFQPPPAKKMPDFVKAQRHFQLLLDKTRSHKKPTQPIPFNFEANKKIPNIHYLEGDNELIKHDKEIQHMRQRNEANLDKMRRTTSQDFVPNATRAFTAKVDQAKKERQERAAKEQKKVAEQKERERKYKENAAKLRTTLAVDEAEKRRKQEERDGTGDKMTKKEQFLESTRTYQAKVKELKTKLDSRPPVYQTCKLR